MRGGENTLTYSHRLHPAKSGLPCTACNAPMRTQRSRAKRRRDAVSSVLPCSVREDSAQCRRVSTGANTGADSPFSALITPQQCATIPTDNTGYYHYKQPFRQSQALVTVFVIIDKSKSILLGRLTILTFAFFRYFHLIKQNRLSFLDSRNLYYLYVYT